MNRADRAKEAVRGLLAEADILLDGRRAWDIRVLNEDLYARVLAGGVPAAGEAYVDGWWEARRLDQFFHRLFLADLHERFADALRTKFDILHARFWTRRGRPRPPAAAPDGGVPGSDVFRAMLGKRMAFTCAYWDGARSLDEAEEAKLELICRKLELKPGMTVLDLACGWGAFAKYAAEKHGVGVVGVSGSAEQVALGRELCAGLPVELLAQDYRSARGRFDRVVSLGITEHIGRMDPRACMEAAAARLKDDGVAFVHTVGRNATGERRDPWFGRALFPDGETPSAAQLTAAMDGLFILEDCHNIGQHYDPTLMAWHDNLRRGWPELEERYGERFYRRLKYSLLSSAGLFRARRSQVYQLVMTKPGRRQPACRPPARAAEPGAARDAYSGSASSAGAGALKPSASSS